MGAIDVHATATTGVIRGVVVDGAIHPISGARVVVAVPSHPALVTNTTAAGAFGFQGLAPGTYAVTASKAGFSAAQTSATVEAAVDRPPAVKLLLLADASSMPYVTTYVFHGYIECSLSSAAASVEVCYGPNAPCDVTGPPAPCNVTQEDHIVRYLLDKPPTFVQSELRWESTQSLGSALLLDHSYDCENTPGCLDYSANGASPVVLRTDAKQAAKAGWGGNDTPLLVRVWADNSDQTPVGVGGATIEQPFTVYTHVFYGYTPPPQWTFGKDGDPPPPV